MLDIKNKGKFSKHTYAQLIISLLQAYSNNDLLEIKDDGVNCFDKSTYHILAKYGYIEESDEEEIYELTGKALAYIGGILKLEEPKMVWLMKGK